MPVSMATKAINSLHVTYISTTPFRTGSEQVEARPPATPVSILYCYGISALLLRVGRFFSFDYSKVNSIEISSDKEFHSESVGALILSLMEVISLALELGSI